MRRTRPTTPQDCRGEVHRSRPSPATPWSATFEKLQRQWHDCIEQGQGLHADRDLDDTSHHNLLAFPYFNFMALTSIRPMSCGCHMQLGKVSVARCSSAHIITPPMMTHRTRDNGRPTMSDRVLCHSTNSGSRTRLWATAHLYSYTTHTVHIPTSFSFPLVHPPLPPHRSFPLLDGREVY